MSLTKKVPFYSNEKDNLHCLQACVCSALSYFEVDFIEDEVDKNTGFFGFPSWQVFSVNWLHSKGLKVKLFSLFDYNAFILSPENYLYELKKDLFIKEKSEGQYNNLQDVKNAAELMLQNHLWEKKQLEAVELERFLSTHKTLAIAKTVHEWLDGRYTKLGSQHYITIIKQYEFGKWLIHDPGLPPRPRRRVNQFLRAADKKIPIFGDVLLVEGS